MQVLALVAIVTVAARVLKQFVTWQLDTSNIDLLGFCIQLQQHGII